MKDAAAREEKMLDIFFRNRRKLFSLKCEKRNEQQDEEI